ncbi:hypothetical protein CsatB_011331 [Cannabis sativa]|jgi:hypothetical protein|uniref:Uncharacterized protein n=2 Tax=Cannabis sativa TaxID=3483 RepID=A0AB40EBW0_CANSA|nr:uncharacterized protein LOC115706591 [Cannabis sativa]KAF4368025.1 hypothetical protein F8388_002636 [Cannabis sativa]KAF4401324.1 hypothetical protein G4B88_014165 [Cannabis sativa]
MSSTDLELRQGLSSSSKINLSPIPIQTPEPSEPPLLGRIIQIQRLNDGQDDENNNKNKINNKINDNNNSSTDHQKEIKENDNDKEKENDDLCVTPTSERYKIPKIVSCPPAPRKPARRVPSCKRKLTELQFFDVKNREDVDEFLRSISTNNSNGSPSSTAAAAKRCCPCK